ncbi:MAG TPA: adenylosuccinate synthase, partial [Vicinamibacterales bacterium]|nr:adenylosuccinate synthase [Vicinamibacterales bacterium]
GNGVVVDPAALFAEIDELAGLGIAVEGRLFISDRAHLILPYHRELDVLSEARRGERKIGTTSRGIGPAYEDKIGRRGVRLCDLADTVALADEIRDNVQARNQMIKDSHVEWRHVYETLLGQGERLKRWAIDGSLFLHQAMSAGRRVLFEGAQGTMLDIDHGTYPYVTSSNASIGGVCTGLGVPPQAIGGVLGVAKAYATRVGEGPFVTELHDAMGERLRDTGHEYGASTGRPRRCGWYDAVAVRYAARVNGLGALALTKLDVLDGIEEIRVAVAYRIDGREVRDFPATLPNDASLEPVYESWPGWTAPTKGATSYAALPAEAQRYIARLEEVSGVPVGLVSTGSDRDETIVRADRPLAAWLK